MCFSHVLERSESKNYHENLGTKFLLHGVMIPIEMNKSESKHLAPSKLIKESHKKLCKC